MYCVYAAVIPNTSKNIVASGYDVRGEGKGGWGGERSLGKERYEQILSTRWSRVLPRLRAGGRGSVHVCVCA